MWQYLLITAGALALCSLAVEGLYRLGLEPQNLILLYILSVHIVARFTSGYLYGVCAAVISSFVFDYLVTPPRLGFSFTTGFPVTFLFMLAVSLLACTVTTQMKRSISQQQAIRMEAEKEKVRSMLLRAISHDLRTPLSGILNIGSIIEQQADTLSSSDIRRLATDVKSNADWLIRIVENLLAVTRITDGTVKVNKTTEVAEEVMARSAAIVRKRFPACQIRVQACETPLLVPMDAILISQMLINLLENAVKNSPAGAPVQLRLWQAGIFARFEVSDRGSGIPEQILEHLFDLHKQNQERTSDSASGMGLGLSICKTIIEAHGGRITGSNKPDGGAVFNILLPLARGEDI